MICLELNLKILSTNELLYFRMISFFEYYLIALMLSRKSIHLAMPSYDMSKQKSKTLLNVQIEIISLIKLSTQGKYFLYISIKIPYLNNIRICGLSYCYLCDLCDLICLLNTQLSQHNSNFGDLILNPVDLSHPSLTMLKSISFPITYQKFTRQIYNTNSMIIMFNFNYLKPRGYRRGG